MGRILDAVVPARLGPRFRWMLASSWMSNLGDGIAVAAGPLLVASLTDDPRLIAMAAVAQWTPPFLFGLLAGALADRLDRRLMVLTGDIGRAVVLVGLVALIATDRVDIGVLLAALFVIATLETFADGAHTTVLPMIVPRSDLGVANARFQFGFMGINRLAGPPIGAALFTAGVVWPFVAQLVCMAFGALLFARILLPPVERSREGTHVLQDIVEGFRWSMRHPAMRALNLQIVTFNVTYGAAFAVLVYYAQERLGLGPGGYGALLTATAVGGVIGAASYGWLERHVAIRNIMRWGLLLETLTHLTLAWTSSAVVAGGILLLFGIHESYWGATASSVRQRAVPDELQGRVASVYVIFMMGGVVAGSALGGLIAKQWGVTAPYWFGFVGSGLILACLWGELGRIAHADEEIRRSAEADR
ncbi:MFS transporter [Nocardioides antri]|uniref:MFS transporter n=1 Tax=Nocardioides antri TaxID=2607659 RepID=A0A5B1M0W8_9ACTN|nr:MFS transporter [Nocardioides antri]KAA1426306.1 MFS transporter [Nocardioides antri]